MAGMWMALKRVALATLFVGGSSVILTAATVGGASGATPPETAVPDNLSFPATTLGPSAYSGPETFTLTNTGPSDDTIDFASPTQVAFSGPGAGDYYVLPRSTAAAARPRRSSLSAKVVSLRRSSSRAGWAPGRPP